MKFQWESIPSNILKKLETSLFHHLPGFTIISLSSFMKGAGEMKFPWYQNPSLCPLIYGRIISFYGEEDQQQTTMNLMDSSTTTTTINQIEFDQQQLRQQADALGLALIVSGMGKCGLKQKDLTKDVYKAIIHGMKKYHGVMNTTDKNMLLTGFTEMELKSSSKKIE